MDNYTLYVHIAPNGKLYFGITHMQIQHRWYSDGSGYKTQQLFWRAIQKYGWNNFKHIILFENLSKEMACECEIALIAKFKSNNPKYGYNIYAGGDLGNKGIKLSESQIQKLREANLGKHHSEETRQKMSMSHKGYKQTQEHIDHVRLAKLGKKLSKEHIEHLKQSHLGYATPEEQKRKQSESLKSYMQSLTPEQRKQIYGKSYINSKAVQLYVNDVFIKEFKSSKDCAEYIGVSPSMVCMLISGKRKSDKYTILSKSS